MRIDHVLLVADDLDRAAEQLRAEYGLASVAGGSHPQWGTANRIVPLGGQYLEIIAVTDPAVADEHPFGRWVRAASADGAILAGLMVEPDDFDATCTRLGLTPTAGERTRPDGASVSWRLAGVAEAISRTVPCFISWDARDDSFQGDARVGATGVDNVELAGDPAALRAWLGDDVAGLRVVAGEPAVRSVTIATRDGHIVLARQPFSS